MSRIDTIISKESKQIDEFEAGDLLTKYRSQEKYFRGLAYDNISGSGPNGALPHYSPVEGNCRIVDRETPYVNDSGAQYLGEFFVVLLSLLPIPPHSNTRLTFLVVFPLVQTVQSIPRGRCISGLLRRSKKDALPTFFRAM